MEFGVSIYTVTTFLFFYWVEIADIYFLRLNNNYKNNPYGKFC